MFVTQDNQEPRQEPLQNPLRRNLSSDGYEQSVEDSKIERQPDAAKSSETRPDLNEEPEVEIKPAADKPVSTQLKKRGKGEAAENKEKTESKLLELKKFDIPELDCIFTDFKTTFDPFTLALPAWVLTSIGLVAFIFNSNWRQEKEFFSFASHA